MVVMAEYSPQDHRLSELWYSIKQLHYSYLETEDSLQKIEQRNKLEGFIREYLCMVPHQNKFCHIETANVMRRSASTKTDFSAYRAALAWNAISMYAGNLLSQPWRKEYRQIKLYSGFYKHEIETNLVGAEIMLELMGYKHTRNSVMTLEGPICPDQVENVSRDSLIAFVECQIIRNIWEAVSSSCKISWLEVLEYREKHIGTPEQAVRGLTSRWHGRNYHTVPAPPPPPLVQVHPVYTPQIISDSYSKYNQMMTAPSPMYSTHVPYGYPSYAQTISTFPTPQPNYVYPLNYSSSLKNPMSPSYGISQPTNGYCFPSQNGTSSIQQARNVPTGQLIELDGPSYTETTNTRSRLYNNNLDPILTSPKARDDGTGTYEEWDYVYKNLDSQGYNKDMGQRGDLLSSESKKSNNNQRKSSKSSKVCDSMDKLKLDDEIRGTNVTHSSSYDNLSSHSSTNKYRANYTGKTKSLPRDSKCFEDVAPSQSALAQTLNAKRKRNKLVKSDSLRSKEKSKDAVDFEPVKPSNKWECNACTYLNSPQKDICDICSKSRCVLEPMSPTVIGGSQCPKCTLINQKDKIICEACGASLTNSPTYI